MGSVADFFFISMAVNFGLILFSLTMLVVYRLFLKENTDNDTSCDLDEAPIENLMEEMEEIPIEV